jgi:signal transduction histidine kinase
MKQWPLVAGVALGATATVETALRASDVVPVALLLGLAATLPLALVRRRPLTVAAALTAATVLTVVPSGFPTVTGILATLAAWVVVAQAQVRRSRAGAAEREAVESTLLELTARGERARIARELHDVVAHHISMISVQAETARVATPGMPPEGAERLLAIGDTARTALAEMRRLLGVLREDAGAEPTRAPQPGLHQLLALIDETRDAAGTSTRLIVRGHVAALDPGVELTAYRVVQEALTNVRRHAPGAAVDVEVDYGADAVCVRVRDNGPGPGAAGRTEGGHGLLGMRERVATVGGELRIGPAPVSGFLVEATLPVRG